MSLKDALSTPPPLARRGGEICKAEQYLSSLPDFEQRALIQHRILDRDWSIAALARLFEQHDVPIPQSTITRHRARRCQCRNMMPELYDPDWIARHLPADVS